MQNGDYGPVRVHKGSIIVVLQVRGTYLAQNPIKMAKLKNRPEIITALIHPESLSLIHISEPTRH